MKNNKLKCIRPMGSQSTHQSMRNGQLLLLNEKTQSKSFGGSLLVGRRKVKRPLSTKLPIHLVLRSSRLRGQKVLAYGNRANSKILLSVARKFHIQIYDYVFNHTHVHILIRIPSRQAYVGFIRVLAAALASLASTPKRGCVKLFDLRPFTRIVSWGRERMIVLRYFKKNVAEAIGGISVSTVDIPEIEMELLIE